MALAPVARADRVEHFVERLRSGSFKVRRQAAYVLAEQAHAALRELAPHLDGLAITRRIRAAPTRRERVQAAILLGALRDQRAVPALLDALQSADPWLRRFAARALGVYAGPEALE